MTKKGTINPYMYRQFENNPLELSKYYRTLEDANMRSMYDNHTDGEFPAVVLSGIRTENNAGSGTDPTDAYIDDDGYLWVVVKPLDKHSAALGDPTLETNPDILKSMIEAHQSCFEARSQYKYDNSNIPVFGQLIPMYYEAGSIRQCTYTKPRFIKPEFPANIHPDYIALGATTEPPTAVAAFQNGRASKIGAFPETKPASSVAQDAFEKKLGDAIRAKGLKFHVTDRARTVEMQMNRILNKYQSRGADEIKRAYGKNRGARMVAAIETGNVEAFRKDAANSSRHLKGAAIDIRSRWYSNSELTTVLAEIRKLGGNPLVEPLNGGCWEKSGRNVTNANRLQKAGGDGKGTPCHNEHIHIDIPEDFK